MGLWSSGRSRSFGAVLLSARTSSMLLASFRKCLSLSGDNSRSYLVHQCVPILKGDGDTLGNQGLLGETLARSQPVCNASCMKQTG